MDDEVVNDTQDGIEEGPDLFQCPRCLISCGNDGSLVVEAVTLQKLEAVNANCHVVAIIGPSRSGKSYLLNRLAKYAAEMIKAKNAKKGGMLSWIYGTRKPSTDEQPCTDFSLDHTMVSQRKGVWVWCRQHPTLDNHVLVLLDFDGIGDPVRASPQYDNKILALAALLSNTLLYNVKSSLDHEDIEKLVFSCRISRRINQLAETTEAVSPKSKLVICIRDFSLLLSDDDEPTSTDDYLDSCLRLKPDTEVDNKAFNRPRVCIRQYFPDRRVFTFDRPGDRSLLLNLEEIPDNKLSKDFLEDINKCCSEVLRGEGISVCSGQDLAARVRSYVMAVEDENFPNLNNSMTSLTSFWNDQALHKAVHKFRQQMEGIELPLFNSKELLEKKFQLKRECLDELQRQVEYDDDNTTASKAEREMDSISKKIEQRNSTLIQEKCSEKLREMFEPIFYNIRQAKYRVAGGYAEFQKDADGMIQKYLEDNSYVDQAERKAALEVFKSSILSKEGEQIMIDDKRQTEVDHQTALLIKEEECFKLRQECQEIFIRQIEEQQRRHDTEMAEMSRKREREDDDDGPGSFIKRIFR